jgi:hypothetical protein
VRALGVDPDGLLYELQVSLDLDPNHFFEKLCDASIKKRFVLHIDPNQCNHVSDKGYNVKFKDGDKYNKNFRTNVNMDENGPKLCGHQYLTIYPLKFKGTFVRPTELPRLVTDVEGHQFYDPKLLTDPLTWFKADDYGSQQSDTTDADETFESYFDAFEIPPELISKQRPAEYEQITDASKHRNKKKN